MDRKSRTQALVRSYLEDHWREVQGKNHGYSLRAYAKFLGISPATLSGFLAKKINLSPRTASSILHKIGVSEDKILAIQSGMAVQYERLPAVDEDRRKLVDHWFYLPLLNVLELPGPHSIASVADTLGLQLKKCQEAVAVLQRLGLLTSDENGCLQATGKMLSVAAFNRELLPYGLLLQYAALQKTFLKSLNDVDADTRRTLYENSNFSGMTVTLDRRLLPEAVERIQKFRRNLANFLESSSQKDDVYRIQIELFPLTKILRESKQK